MKWPSVRSMPASSSPAIFASSVTARRSTIWKSPWATSIAAWSGRCWAGPIARTIHYAETLAGDSTAGHAAAYCRAVEALSATRVPARGQFLRGVALELERVANHIGDLGALAGDVGFLPTMSYCGRIRGDVLNMTAMLCGNRFGRGMIRPGGVAFDVDARLVEQLRRRLDAVARDARSAVELLWDTPSVMARFDGVGVVPLDLCEQLGLVGVAARACGAARDVRRDFPYGIYRFAHIPVSTWHSGDVFARAHVRWLEVQRSLAFIGEQLDALPEGHIIERGRSPGGRPGGRNADRGLARRDLPRRHDRPRRPFCRLQGGRSVVPQLVRPGNGPAQPADFRLPFVQQEFQPFLLRSRFVRTIMLQVTLARLNQGHRTIAYPAQPPALPERFRGLPIIDRTHCRDGCRQCADACPTHAIALADGGPRLDLGRCLFCTDCTEACPAGALRFTQDHRLATRRREDLLLDGPSLKLADGARRRNRGGCLAARSSCVRSARRAAMRARRISTCWARWSSTSAVSASSSWPRPAMPTASSSPAR